MANEPNTKRFAVPHDLMSVSEWCAAHSISKAFFYKLPTESRPAVIRLGRRVLISREAAAEWRKRMEAQTMEGA